jgi:hypothetical protein
MTKANQTDAWHPCKTSPRPCRRLGALIAVPLPPD